MAISLRVLVVEDNQDVSDNIRDYLEGKGHYVDFAFDGISGLHRAATHSFDVIVLDIMLPGIDGFSFCQRYCAEAENPAPVLMLTAKDTLEDKLKGFNSGADDYLLKPFELQELEARILVLARRSRNESPRFLSLGNLKIDIGQRTVKQDGSEIKLNRTCFRILVELMRASPDVVTREDLEHLLWGDYIPTSDVLRSHIYTLRKALDKRGHESLIETVMGVGFRIRMKQ